MAFIAVLHAFVLKTFYVYGSDSCLELTLQSAKFSQTQGLGDTVWAKEIDQRHEAWGQDLPKNSDEVWDFLIRLDEVSRRVLFAHCACLSLNAVIEPWNKRTRALAHADQVARSIGFDLVEAGWTPTIDNYLGRVTKAHILQAVREAKGEQSAQLIDHLKKQDMAREAERLLEGSGWLPELLRLAGDGIPNEGIDAAADELSGDDIVEASSVTLPDFLTEDVGDSDTDLTPNDDLQRHLDAAE
jgi:ParB family chromosome partitioning protein